MGTKGPGDEQISLVGYGVCRFCGQVKYLEHPMPTQEQADEYATKKLRLRACQGGAQTAE